MLIIAMFAWKKKFCCGKKEIEAFPERKDKKNEAARENL